MGGRKRGKETSMCGCLSCPPYWGPGLQPRHVPWLEIEPMILWFTKDPWSSVHWATPARATNLKLLEHESLWWFEMQIWKLGPTRPLDEQIQTGICTMLPCILCASVSVKEISPAQLMAIYRPWTHGEATPSWHRHKVSVRPWVGFRSLALYLPVNFSASTCISALFLLPS